MKINNKNFGMLTLLLSICSLVQTTLDNNKENKIKFDQYEVHQFKAHNGIRFEYSLWLPATYDKAYDYEIVALLSEVETKDNAWDKSMKILESVDLNRTIVIVPKVPIGKEHWGTHPIHHGFNDLLKSVRESHGKPDQKFHLIGLEAGHQTAFWWTYGSSDLIASTSIINGTLWNQDSWDKKWYNNLAGSHVPIYAYENAVIDKFDMPAFTFHKKASLSQVISDIENRNTQ